METFMNKSYLKYLEENRQLQAAHINTNFFRGKEKFSFNYVGTKKVTKDQIAEAKLYVKELKKLLNYKISVNYIEPGIGYWVVVEILNKGRKKK
jgi:hypothetical protein